MPIHLEAILPKKYHNAKTAREALDGLLKMFQVEAAQELQRYPPWRPWKNPPKSGVRAGGKRTGNLGRNWGTYRLVSGKSIEMVNKTTYAKYVQGDAKSQARALAARGWQRVDEVGRVAARRAIEKATLYPDGPTGRQLF